MAKEHIITALDIGTTKICCLIGVVDSEGKIEIRGAGMSKSTGLSQGMIRNIRSASESMNIAIREAEKSAELPAENLYVGVAGELIQSFVGHGIAPIESVNHYGSEKCHEVKQREIDMVIEDAKKHREIPPNRKIINTDPQFFIIDGVSGIHEPIGMTGQRIEADVHFVTADMNSLYNIQRSLQALNLEYNDVVLQPLASAMAVLNSDERELGAILIDIGGGTSDISIYYKDSIRFSCIIPMGGENITNDLSVGLRTPKAEAEKIKIEYGFATPDRTDDNLKIDIPGIGGRLNTQRSQKFIAEIIHHRMEQIVDLIHKELKQSKYLNIVTAGISVCGGSANLRNINRLFDERFELPTKTGYPTFNKIYGETELLSNPRYATAIGLLHYGLKKMEKDSSGWDRRTSMFDRLLHRVRKWFSDQNYT